MEMATWWSKLGKHWQGLTWALGQESLGSRCGVCQGFFQHRALAQLSYWKTAPAHCRLSFQSGMLPPK